MVKAIGSSAKASLNDERKQEMNVLHSWVVALPQIFRKTVLIGVRPVNNTNGTNLAATRYIKRKKTSLPADMRGSKTTFKLPPAV